MYKSFARQIGWQRPAHISLDSHGSWQTQQRLTNWRRRALVHFWFYWRGSGGIGASTALFQITQCVGPSSGFGISSGHSGVVLPDRSAFLKELLGVVIEGFNLYGKCGV